MKIQLKELKIIIQEAVNDYLWIENFNDDPKLNEPSVFVPKNVQKQIKNYFRKMRLSQ